MMHCLIDGYNLLHAMGVLHGRTGPTGLEKARLGLLGLLKATYGEEASAVTVVFDAAHALPGAPAARDYQGIRVRFAVQEAEADDLIESLIQHDAVPKHLTVVSDDHRIQQAARHRHCLVLGCGDYLEWLAKSRRARRQRSADPPAKPAAVSEDDAEFWLREFADLQDDPALKELSEPLEWNDLA
jgi:predicted RNA-binding protein with PIN domain